MTAKTYKKTMSGSIGAGMKSLFGESGRRFYTLEHKVSSRYHKAGESQQIIVDQIELGRSSTCQVRFDDQFPTVSRRHAAIIKDGDNWKLVHLSETNSTYLNGHKIQKEWYLQNGDEIQLSTNGPKLGFLVAQGEKGLVKSIGLTARLNLFRKQALRPYKQALTALSCIFIAAMAACGYVLIEQDDHITTQQAQLAELERAKQAAEIKLDSIQRASQATTDQLSEELRRARITNATLANRIEELSRRVDEIPTHTSTDVTVAGVSDEALKACMPYVYFISTVGFEITLPDGSSATVSCSDDDIPGWTGTGFLLNDGRFVTARHVAEAWYFWKDGSGTNEKLALFNLVANNGGKVVAHFVAVSSSGDQLQFTSDQFTCDHSGDQRGTNDDGHIMSLGQLNDTDYAYLETGRTNGLKFNKEKCDHLEMRTELTVLGFPLGLGANAIDDIHPVYGNGIAAANGLTRGMIVTTNTNYEQGNSGGPVFYTDENGELAVVGIVSAGMGRVTGLVVPISAIY